MGKTSTATPISTETPKRRAQPLAQRPEVVSRRTGADQRAQDRAHRTPAQQLEVLDSRLGKGQGADWERYRLHEQNGTLEDYFRE